jgi:hypothetical protein
MTRRERDDLSKLIRQRAKVEKAGLTQRKAEMMAEFERQISAIYHWDDDAVWTEANEAAEKAVQEARTIVAERCRKLGIPHEFAPQIQFAWFGRGQNAVSGRRSELRKAAKARVDAMEAAAKTDIERASVEAQTQLLAGGLTSEAAKEYLANLPSLESLMPHIDAKELVVALPNRPRLA